MRPIETDTPAGAAPAGALNEHRRFPLTRVWGLVLLTGVIAGFTSWLIGEAIHGRFGPPEVIRISKSSGGTLSNPEIQKLSVAQRAAQTFEATLTFGSLGAVLGLALGLAGAFARGSARSALKAAVVGSLLGGAAGYALTKVMLPIYFRVLDPDTNDLIVGIMIQVVISCAIGAAGGVAFGIGLGDRSRFVRAVIGGLLGAVAGALFYEMIGAIAFPSDKISDPISLTWATRLFARLAVMTFASAGVAFVALDQVKEKKAISSLVSEEHPS